MFKGNFTEKEKGYIRRASEIEIEYLLEIAQSKTSFNNIREMLKHPEKHEGQIKHINQTISLEVLDFIQEFEKVKEEPNYLFSLDIVKLDIIVLILTEYFEDEWANEDDDAIEFMVLCEKILSFTDFLETNNTSLN
jgi:hypothetical protein